MSRKNEMHVRFILVFYYLIRSYNDMFWGLFLELDVGQPQRWDQSLGEGVMALKGNKEAVVFTITCCSFWKITFIFELVAGYLLSGREDPNSEGNLVQIVLLILCKQPEDNFVIYSSTFRLYRPGIAPLKACSGRTWASLCVNGPAACMWKQ